MDLEDVYEEIACDPYWDHLRLPGIQLVPGFGQRRPKVLLVGEAPGATENRRLRPFCGPSGRVLDQLMALAGLRLEDIEGRKASTSMGTVTVHPMSANAFVTNVVKYRPSGNRTPTLPEIMHARDGYSEPVPPILTGEKWEEDYRRKLARHEGLGLKEGAGSLRREWAALGRPRVIVCVGGVAHSALSPMNYQAISRHVGRPYYKHSSTGTAWFISQFHPAYGLRQRGNPKVLQQIEQDWEDMGKFLSEEGLL